MTNHDVPLRLVRRAAAAADCDVRTALKVARGQRVRGVVAERIAEELRRLGVTVPEPRTEARA